MSKLRKRVLIAGGAGFVGAHLCKRFVDSGCHVVCIDDLSTGRIKNIANVQRSPNFEFMQQDIVEPVVVEGNIDEIYHLASPASPPQYQLDPIQTFQTNVIGALNLLELARQKGSRILLASTSEVYGDPIQHPQKEDYWGNVNPNGIRSCYDEGKRSAETLFCDYHRMYGVDVRIVRIFNTYGPNMSKEDGRVVSNFITQALKNEPITINGDGKQTRSFQYVDDLINGILQVMEDGVPCVPINIGNPQERTVASLAELVLKLTNSSSRLKYKKLPSDDPKVRCPDITRARTFLRSWQPMVGIEQGLSATIEYFRNELQLST